MTKDGVLVLFHDDHVRDKTDFDKRPSNWPESTGEVENLDWTDLKKLKLNVSDRQQILKLDELSELVRREKTVNWILDLKSDGMKFKVLDWLKESKLALDRVILFGEKEILDSYQESGYRLGYTVLYRNHKCRMLFYQSEIFKNCENLNCDLMVVPIIFLTPDLVRRAKAEAIEVWCYDSNHEADLRYAVDCGITGLIVDYPADIKEYPLFQ